MGIHGYDGGEVFDFEFPDGFGGAEFFEEVDAADFLDAFGQDLGSAADGVQVNTAVIFAGLDCFFTHAAVADDAAQTEIAKYLPSDRWITLEKPTQHAIVDRRWAYSAHRSPLAKLDDKDVACY